MTEQDPQTQIEYLRARRARIASAIARLNKLTDQLWEEELKLRTELSEQYS